MNNLVSVTMRDSANKLIQVIKDEYGIQEAMPGGRQVQAPGGGSNLLDAWTRQV